MSAISIWHWGVVVLWPGLFTHPYPAAAVIGMFGLAPTL